MDEERKKVMLTLLECIAKDAHVAQQEGATIGDFMNIHENNLMNVFGMVEQLGLDTALQNINLAMAKAERLEREFGTPTRWLN